MPGDARVMAIYPYVEFVHIAAVVLWLGGGCLCIFSAIKAERAHNAADFARVLRDIMFFVTRLFIPAALVALAAGLTMAYLAELFAELWIWIGIAGIAATSLLGLLVMKPRGEKLLVSIERGGASDAVFGPGRQLLQIAKFDYVMLFTVASNMVLKPTPSDVAVLAVMAAVVLGAAALFLVPVLRAAPHPAEG
ncbi:MAG TPA: DUF2269 family protein [Xanthobacteraceae bacterium]|nr:DUF2269 family protein [Xanthobacteraceae bacterium]